MSGKANKIGLGVITRRRPEGLRQLLESFAQLNLPDGIECVVLIAENDDSLSIQPIVDGLREVLPFAVTCVVETEHGIPFARNRVLDMALEQGCDFLTFVDDDDVVHKDWLLMLYTTMTGRGFDLVGGALAHTAPDGLTLTWQQRAVFTHLQGQERRKLRIQSSKVATADEALAPVYTHNWMLRLAAQQRLGVRFDQALRYTGGSDTKFYQDFSDAGGKTGWSSDARVIETWTAERLSFRYVFRRARDQETMLRRIRKTEPNPLFSLRTIRKLLRILGLIIKSPTNQFRTLTSAAAVSGELAGQINAFLGRSSEHYRTGPDP